MSAAIDTRGTTTPVLGLNKPTIGGDINVWGDQLNANADILDQVLVASPRIVNVMQKGARCDGVQDDSAAWAAAIAAATTAATFGGAVLEIPPGRSMVATALPITVKPGASLTIRGAGHGVSEVYCTGATDGFVITLGAGSDCTVEGFKLTRGRASPVNANTALSISGPGSGPMAGHVTIRNVFAEGSTAAVNGWATGFSLYCLPIPIIDGCSIRFADCTGSPNDGNAVVITGTPDPVGNSTNFAIDAKLSNFFVQGGNAGVITSGGMQGVFMVNSEVIGSNYGICADHVGTDYAEGILVTNCHFNNNIAGIYTRNFGWVQVSHNLFLRFQVGSNWTAAFHYDTCDIAITGNNIFGTLAGGEYGIYLYQSPGYAASNQPNTITGNVLENLLSAGIALQGDVKNTVVTGNGLDRCLTLVLDNSTNPSDNLILGNRINGVNDLSLNLSFSTLATPYTFMAGGNAQNSADIQINAAAGSARTLSWATGGVQRWFLAADATSETGGNTGSNLILYNVDDAGAPLSQAMNVDRATGIPAFPSGIKCGPGVATWYAGPGIPTYVETVGSLHSRTDGTLGARLYVSAGAGVWNAVAGV